MKELKNIIDTYKKIDFSLNKAAIATVVRVQGSSYRRTGARMIIIDNGVWTGGISGGCLEGDALRKARQAILLGKPSLVTYDTMQDKDAMDLGVGLGCNGIIDVLIEPIDHLKPDQMVILERVLQLNKPAVLATIYSTTDTDSNQNLIGKQWLMDAKDIDIKIFGRDNSNFEFLDELLTDMKFVYNNSSSCNKEYLGKNNEQLKIFIEFFRPAIHLIIFGGGFDAIPLLNFSKQLGWNVTITDDCVAHIAPSRFPMADKLVHASRHEVVKNLDINKYTAAVLLSHNFKYDFSIFKELIKTKVPYVGILGPRKKFDKMVEQLQEEGIFIDEDKMEKIHAPVGLDIGAELPEEIAISIIAEIQGKFNQCAGAMLRDKDGPIHGKSEEDNIVQAYQNLKFQ